MYSGTPPYGYCLSSEMKYLMMYQQFKFCRLLAVSGITVSSGQCVLLLHTKKYVEKSVNFALAIIISRLLGHRPNTVEPRLIRTLLGTSASGQIIEVSFSQRLLIEHGCGLSLNR